MYLAPLNYDRFFKKVFSDISIAKQFLEDFFDVNISSITPLQTRHKITDNSTAVEFDFRCEMDGQFVIVDMQQWFKMDIVKRFYVYHSLNSALQLQDLTLKSIPLGDNKKQDTLNYQKLEPVLTLIWMADDTLGFDDDIVAYSLTPEQVSEFVSGKNTNMWRNEDIAEIMKERARVLSLMQNTNKNLDFLPQNRLIYAFQKNIVKNQKIKKYFDWFEFAEKSKNKENKKEDFKRFENIKVFKDVIKRLDKSNLQSDDFQYITDYDEFRRSFKETEDSIFADGRIEGLKEGLKEGEEKGIEKGIEKGLEIAAEGCLKQGLSIEVTAKAIGLTIEQVTEIAQRLNLG